MKAQKVIIASAAAGAGYLAASFLRRPPLMNLRGKTVLITGGSRGLGLALAREFGSHGASVVIRARDEAALHRAQEDLTSRRVPTQTVVCDVTDRKQVES